MPHMLNKSLSLNDYFKHHSMLMNRFVLCTRVGFVTFSAFVFSTWSVSFCIDDYVIAEVSISWGYNGDVQSRGNVKW